jgi:hypothetical protein
MPGFYVAAAVVTLLQFLRVREWRLLLLLALFLFQAGAHAFGAHPNVSLLLSLISGLSGVALVWVLSPYPRHPSH